MRRYEMNIASRIILLLSLLILNYDILSAGSPGVVCGTDSPGVPGIQHKSIGVLKVLVVFAQFKGDMEPDTTGGWPLNTYPTWGSGFVNSSGNGGGPFPYNNLSQYFFEMSNGIYKIEGDEYSNLVTTNKNENQYSNLGEANREVLTRIDPYVILAPVSSEQFLCLIS
jgi:hypothetical protein